MKALKPSFEQINPSFGSSILVRQFNEVRQNSLPFWHFHPEIELVYVNGGKGKRHIGSHMSYFRNGELILIGANLPHFGFTDRLSSSKLETIVQMKPEFLGEAFFDIPEMEQIRKLFERAKKGISFHGESKRKIGHKIEQLPDLKPFDRLLHLLTIFSDLSKSDEYMVLNAGGIVLEVNAQDNRRMDLIYNYVRNNFQETIKLNDIASLVSMTEPSFCRYFKKLTGKTFTRFVNECRLVHAAKLLSENPTSITEICFISGFNNFSHFNKLFKEFTGKSPRDYRNEIKYILSDDDQPAQAITA